VFGGLYLPHLRQAIWQQLAIAERELRTGQPLAAELIDIDGDGADEVWVHGATLSAIIAPARGGAMIELTRFDTGLNYADTLTRRLEVYHLPPIAHAHGHGGEGGAPSIHDLEGAIRLDAPPPVDLDDRAIGVARIVCSDLTPNEYAAATYTPRISWARTRCAPRIETGADSVTVHCDAPGFAVTWLVRADGNIEARYRWDAPGDRDALWFAPELSLAHPLAVGAPDSAATWRYAIETVAKSEQGLERVRQGESVTPLFDARRTEALVTLAPDGGAR
jgi:alpha-amylase